VPLVSVLIAATVPDIKADGIAAGIVARDDMILIEQRVVTLNQVPGILARVPEHQKTALVLVGSAATTEELTDKLLKGRANLVILRVDIVGDEVRVALRDIGLQSLLSTLRELAEHVGSSPEERFTTIQVSVTDTDESSKVQHDLSSARPLLRAAVRWIHGVLQRAVSQLPEENSDLPGGALTKAAVAKLMADPRPSESPDLVSGAPEITLHETLLRADATTEPLAAIAQALQLTRLEFRLLLLVLAPELDPRYQRCMALLQDDASRRAGTVALLASLLGNPPEVRLRLSMSSHGARWRLWDTANGHVPPADETMRLDPHLVEWILGSRDALDQDVRVRRLTRASVWAGATLLDSQEDAARALEAVRRTLLSAQTRNDPAWVVFSGNAAARWRALLERGAQLLDVAPIRVDAALTSAADAADLDDAGCRIGRMARMMGRPLIVDAENVPPQEDERLRRLLEAIGRSAARASIICSDLTRIARILGVARFSVISDAAEPASRVVLVKSAAQQLHLQWSEDKVGAHALQYPLREDGFELAVRLALSRPLLGRARRLCGWHRHRDCPIGQRHGLLVHRRIDGLDDLSMRGEHLLQNFSEILEEMKPIGNSV